jgi:uncharacterized GH25 family protein
VKRFIVALAFVLVAAIPLAAHDLFLKLDTYVVAPNADVKVKVLNGTFTTSENGVTRDRIVDITLVAPDTVMRIDHSQWDTVGKSSVLAIHTRGPGVYVVGASTKPRELKLEAKEFNAYLEEEGIRDILAARTKAGTFGDPARERYAKHVKALFRVGSATTGQFDRALGYPAEIVPIDNPYTLRPGMTLRVRCLVDGAPSAHQVVLAGGRTPSGARLTPITVTADSAGIASIRLRGRGTWYVKFIRMRPVTGDASVDYESKWATMTFEVR